MVVKFTVSARAQFLAAIESIRQKSPTAARQFRQRAGKSLKRLGRFSESGAVVAEFPGFPYREIYVPPYRFFYRVRVQTVWIVAVWHGAEIPDEPENSMELDRE